ncbi:hypothetical protein H2200_007521 [Cladophialophora chaetospira]|uniref:FAD/NAD(P)-binding domain-containing protein n=1 Tax=Cladophialophora chaetospira TaxID=386627 RepID=A0AA39CHR1_9EURO|nr:hypothetical protein H2200_007521 [Cladophialophora chaetospira]
MAATSQRFGAAVVGAGPAGIAVVGNLLARGVRDVLWVDPVFSAGRLHKKYREVPSNTKVSLFVQFAEAVKPFEDIISNTPSPHAVDHLESLDQDRGCRLSAAADMCRMLTEGLVKRSVTQAVGRVRTAGWKRSAWSIDVDGQDEKQAASSQTADLLVLCNGSHPKSIPLPDSCKHITNIHLDTALAPSILRNSIRQDQLATIAVIGTSHSAVLALLNLYTLAKSSHPNLHIKWFARSKLLYAVPKDGWILYDNTGLKGEAAVWAKEHLEDDKLKTNAVVPYIEKVELGANESFTESARLQECSHIVQAIGYSRNPLPELLMNGQPLRLKHNPYSGGYEDQNGKKVPSLYGAGIAWPETVKDPYGNVESAVGLFKFMRFAKRAVPEWMEIAAL